MKREYFSHAAKDARRHSQETTAERCIVLIDARYLAWLAHPAVAGSSQASVNRIGLADFLTDLLLQSGLEVNLKRIYWYAEVHNSLDVEGQIVRKVFPHDVDGGVSLLQTMGQDLRKLADNKACEHVLLATDDERFFSAIDDAQLTGMSVHILADDAARNMSSLHQTDPGWGRLLSQADRRIVVQSKVLADFLQGANKKEVISAPDDPEMIRESMTEVIVSWWDDEPEDKREELRDELHVNRGIPQEVDRQLLLRMRHRLTRALTLHEKKMLREIFRAVAFGTLSIEANQSADALSAMPVIEEPL